MLSKNATFAEGPSSKGKPGMVEKFKSRLKLSSEQTQRLQAVLHEAHQEFSQLHESAKPQFEEIRQEMRSKIRQMLNEEQKREYEAMIRERDARKAGRPNK